MRSMFGVCGVLLLSGGGCLPFASTGTEVAAEDVVLRAGATVTIVQNWLGLDPVLASEEGADLRNVTIDAWTPGESAALSWSKTERVETDASKAARALAAQAPIGAATTMPDAVFETVTISGTLRTDALGNAERILLPSYWPEGAYDVSGEENSVLWLSRAQYDELVATRSSHIALGLFDSALQDAIDVGEAISGALAKLQGNIAKEASSKYDVTQLTAEGDWGEYVLTLNGERARVRTIEASSMFAEYVILANAENPLILRVSVKPLSLGVGMVTTLSALQSLAGYRVTALTN